MITGIRVRSYKSLADVNVTLGPLTVFVGPNGSGKSNLIDVLRFVQESLRLGLDSAITNRQGFNSLSWWTPKRRPNILVEFNLSGVWRRENLQGQYTFEITGEVGGGWSIAREHCRVHDGGTSHEFEVQRGNLVRSSYDLPLPAPTDKSSLALNVLGGRLPFTFVRSELRNIDFCTIFPNTLREPQKLDVPRPLKEHAENLASTIRHMKKKDSPSIIYIREALGRVVEGVVDFSVTQVGGYLVIKLKHQRAEGKKEGPWFDISQESDGTIRMLGLLFALYQDPPSGVLCIEEPELTIHPGALGVLSDLIKESSTRTQLLITTHSPDLISRFSAEELRIVEKEKGATKVDPIATAQLEAINQKLFSPGDLLRIEGLRRA
jgi:predicted ATPase